jgi:putative oxidoreductase
VSTNTYARHPESLGWHADARDDFAALIARVVLGGVMFAHGSQKAFGWFGGDGLHATLEGMTQQGLPFAVGLLVVVTELLASLALLVGFVGRLAAVGVIAIMTGAIYLVHWPNGFFMNWTGKQAGEGYEYHLLAIALALVVCIKGSGAGSLDRALSSAEDEVSDVEPRESLAHVGIASPDD